MSTIDRKALARAYKETALPAGIYRVRNTTSGRSLVGSSTNLPGMLNRQRFQLEHGSHPDRELQRDWNELGAGAFTFEILDRLEPQAASTTDPVKELETLRELWMEKLTAAGEPLYAWSR